MSGLTCICGVPDVFGEDRDYCPVHSIITPKHSPGMAAALKVTEGWALQSNELHTLEHGHRCPLCDAPTIPIEYDKVMADVVKNGDIESINAALVRRWQIIYY